MKNSFARWYAEEVRDALGKGITISDIKVDLRASVIKPLHTNWVISAISTLSERKEALKKSFESAGIIDFIDK